VTDSPTPDREDTSQDSATQSPRAVSSGTWVFVFLAVLVGFNVFIFFGSREIWSRIGGNPRPPVPGQPAPGQTRPPGQQPPVAGDPSPQPGRQGSPPPPPPPQGTQPGGVKLAGPELILGLVALKQAPKVGLSGEQSRRCAELLSRLEAPQAAMQESADAAMRCLTAEQVSWVRANRGNVELDSQEVLEPGMDPVTSAAFRLLQGKAAQASGAAQPIQHEERDLQLHDLLNGLIKLEGQGGSLVASPEQARALLPVLTRANEARKAEIKVFEELLKVLTQEQVTWIQANPERSRMDVNRVILRYGQMILRD